MQQSTMHTPAQEREHLARLNIKLRDSQLRNHHLASRMRGEHQFMSVRDHSSKLLGSAHQAFMTGKSSNFYDPVREPKKLKGSVSQAHLGRAQNANITPA